jgi:hypothetical protein
MGAAWIELAPTTTANAKALAIRAFMAIPPSRDFPDTAEMGRPDRVFQ